MVESDTSGSLTVVITVVFFGTFVVSSLTKLVFGSSTYASHQNRVIVLYCFNKKLHHLTSFKQTFLNVNIVEDNAVF